MTVTEEYQAWSLMMNLLVEEAHNETEYSKEHAFSDALVLVAEHKKDLEDLMAEAERKRSGM